MARNYKKEFLDRWDRDGQIIQRVFDEAAKQEEIEQAVKLKEEDESMESEEKELVDQGSGGNKSKEE